VPTMLIMYMNTYKQMSFQDRMHSQLFIPGAALDVMHVKWYSIMIHVVCMSSIVPTLRCTVNIFGYLKCCCV